MSSLTVFVGLDYHPGSVQVCVMDGVGTILCNGTRGNDAAELDRVVRQYGDRIQSALEVSPGAAHLADELVSRYGWSVDLAHPGYVSRMKQGPDKTDYSDARLLADLERVGYLPKVWLAPPLVRELRRLVRYRQQLVNDRRNAKLRIRAILRDLRLTSPHSPWTKRWREWLEQEVELPSESRWVIERQWKWLDSFSQEIKEVEKRLEEVTRGDALVQRLLTLEGIGPVTATTLRAEIGQFERFRTGKQLARFCGVTPCNASSGSRQADAGLVKASNPELRRVLIETAHRLGRLDDRWQQQRQKMRERGKPACVIAAAIANRWTRWLYHQMTQPLANQN